MNPRIPTLAAALLLTAACHRDRPKPKPDAGILRVPSVLVPLTPIHCGDAAWASITSAIGDHCKMGASADGCAVVTTSLRDCAKSGAGEAFNRLDTGERSYLLSVTADRSSPRSGAWEVELEPDGHGYRILRFQFVPFDDRQ